MELLIFLYEKSGTIVFDEWIVFFDEFKIAFCEAVINSVYKVAINNFVSHV